MYECQQATIADNLDGKIDNERFARMTATYEQKQKDIEARVITLRETICTLVERIDVFTPEKIPDSRTKKQTILIHWNFIGAVDLPQEQEKSA